MLDFHDLVAGPRIVRAALGRLRGFFAGKPFRLDLSLSRSVGSIVGDLLEQAARRQASSSGTNVSGAVLQHLVGAQLELTLGKGEISHRKFTGEVANDSVSTAESPTGRLGDFCIGNAAIHVTIAPSEAVMKKCELNLEASLRPILVTTRRQFDFAFRLAEHLGLTNRIDFFDVEQFIAINVYKKGGFSSEGRKRIVLDLIDCYNEIIDVVEKDPSLKIIPL